jgi:signal transduction histidine kinase
MGLRAAATMVLGRPFATATWRDTGYLVLGTLTGAIAFSAFFVAVTVGGLMALTILGLPVLLLCFRLVRATAGLDRRRAALVLGRPIESRYHQAPDDRIWTRLTTAVKDLQTWKDVAWLGVGSAVSFFGGVAAAALWLFGVTQLTLPLWWWIDHRQGDDPGIFHVDTWGLAVLACLAGVGICLATPWVMRLLAFVESWLATVLLGPGRRAALEERVLELAETRAGAVDAQAAELQRIERDLHDGAQARLVALALDLGLAREKLETDPDSARVLVESAHEEAKTAIKELRELVRGIHPSILSDRGLDAALTALAARCPVPVALSVRLHGRLPAAVEAAAYFVVNEALANVAKHSGATRCEVDVERANGSIAIEVSDDGRGGASSSLGTGIAGLERRLRSLDGRLVLKSPVGGPTTLRADIPCAS